MLENEPHLFALFFLEAHHASVAERLNYIEQLVGDSFERHSREIQSSHTRLETMSSSQVEFPDFSRRYSLFQNSCIESRMSIPKGTQDWWHTKPMPLAQQHCDFTILYLLVWTFESQSFCALAPDNSKLIAGPCWLLGEAHGWVSRQAFTGLVWFNKYNKWLSKRVCVSVFLWFNNWTFFCLQYPPWN